jgi:hypothetical protein
MGGLVAGVLDAVDGVVAFGLKGLNPLQVLQYIASGLLGPASFQGGFGTAAVGTVLHFFIAFAAVAPDATSEEIASMAATPILSMLLWD